MPRCTRPAGGRTRGGPQGGRRAGPFRHQLQQPQPELSANINTAVRSIIPHNRDLHRSGTISRNDFRHENSTPRWMMCKRDGCVFASVPEFALSIKRFCGTGAKRMLQLRGHCRSAKGCRNEMDCAPSSSATGPRIPARCPPPGFSGSVSAAGHRRAVGRCRRGVAGMHAQAAGLRRPGGGLLADPVLAAGPGSLLAGRRRRGLSPRRPAGPSDHGLSPWQPPRCRRGRRGGLARLPAHGAGGRGTAVPPGALVAGPASAWCGASAPTCW